MGLYLSTTDPRSNAAPARIQTYLPSAPTTERNFPVFSAYDAETKVYTTVAVHYPSKDTMTVWTSTVSGTDIDSMKAVPILDGVQMKFPVSSSPSPLNIAALEVSKIVSGPNGGVLAIFTNGEVHAIDANNKQFTLLHKIISDERALDVDFPTTMNGHVYDKDRQGLWSIVSAGMFSYVIFTDFKTNTVGPWVKLDAKMKLDPGSNAMTTDFSPEWFVNAMMVDAGDGNGSQLMIQLNSISDDVGFDQLSFVNTTSGAMTGPVQNMAAYELVMQCAAYGCDKWRNSAYDPVSKTVYWQAHSFAKDTAGQIQIAGLTFDTLKNGKPSFYVNIANPDAAFGYTGYQFYNF